MSQNKLAVEVMDGTGAWIDLTPDVMGLSVDGVGLTAARGTHARVGRCRLTLKNTTKTYTPDVTGSGSALLDGRRRVRVRGTGSSLGKCLQATHNGAYGFGGTTTISASGFGVAVGTTTSIDRRNAQSFLASAGQLTQITLTLLANVGTPTGTATWEIRNDAGGTAGPGSTVLATGTFTPTQNATNTINVSNGPALLPNTKYWVVFYSTTLQASPETYWQWQIAHTSTYPDGNFAQSSNGGTSWTDFPTFEGQCSITTGPINCYLSQQQSVSTAINDVWVLSWQARAQFDSQYNVDTVRIALDTDNSANYVPSLFSYTNKWATYIITWTSPLTSTTVTPQFFPQFTGSGLNSTRIEYRSVTLKKNGGANVLVNGDFSSGAISPWAANNVTTPSATVALAVADDTWTLFNGVIEDIYPDPFASAGGLKSRVVCYDFTVILQYQNVDLPLQKDQTSDQLMTTLSALLPLNTLNTTLPGKRFASGRQIFQRAFDGYSKNQTTILEAASDAVASEYARAWFDRDGTLRASSRDTLPQGVTSPAKLTLAGGQPFDMLVRRSMETVTNKSIITYHPRQIGGGVQALATAQSVINVPPATSATQPGQTTITLNFRDVAGNLIGGENVITPLVPHTDYEVSGGDQSFTDTAIVTISNYQVSASQITMTFNNGAVGNVQVTFLQVRGNPVYQYDPVTLSQSDPMSIARYQERVYSKDLAFANDQNFAASLGNYYLAQYKTPFTEVQQLSIDHRAALAGVDLLSLELMDTVSISDTQTNLSAVKHMIVGLNYELDPAALDYVKNVTFILERLDQQTYWILEDSTYSVLDSTTVLYI